MRGGRHEHAVLAIGVLEPEIAAPRRFDEPAGLIAKSARGIAETQGAVVADDEPALIAAFAELVGGLASAVDAFAPVDAGRLVDALHVDAEERPPRLRRAHRRLRESRPSKCGDGGQSDDGGGETAHEKSPDTRLPRRRGNFETERAMAETEPPRSPVAAVGVVCLRGREVLLIRRANPPRQGEWSLPGGRIERGERAADAALRELREETGVAAELVGLVDVVDAFFASHYVLIDYAARWIAGEPRAGDDAADARFFPRGELDALGLWEETLRVIDMAMARYD